MRLEVPESMLKKAGMIPLWEEEFGFFRAHKRITMYGPTETYSYSHLSLQEFLAAFHITQLDEHDRAAAFKRIYEQNPLCHALSFYAGLTGLRSKEIRSLLFLVLEKPFDLATTVKALKETGDIRCDRRRQLLSLMNCIYETQQATLVNHVLLTPNYSHRLMPSSELTSSQTSGQVRIPLSFMLLYTTDCLSIGYFIRHACSSMQKVDPIFLLLTGCCLGTLEIKALCQELSKPAQMHKLILNISFVRLTSEAIDSIKAILTPQSALFGLIITGSTVENIHLALKYITEGISINPHCRLLVIHELNASDPMPIAHHLALLLCCCELSILELSGSTELFVNPKVMSLFCEALKHSTELQRLILDSCGINDDLLVILARALTSGCNIRILDFGWNPHTSKGLTNFLKILICGVQCTPLLTLASSTDINAEHQSLVEQFNHQRHHFYPSYDKLTVGCKNKLCPKDVVESNIDFFNKSPQYIIRYPHE